MHEKKIFGPCSEKQRMVLQDNTTDVLLVGGGAGGGKSRVCLTKYLPMLSDPNARIAIFRQTHPQLLMPGALVDESHHIYPYFNGKYGTQKKKWTFPSGASITFSAIADSRDTAGWQGSQLSHILIDEAAEWGMETVLFLLSRLRSATFKGKLQMVMSCNPDRHSFLYEWVKPFLDDDGVPKPGTENIIRWFVVLGGTVYWGDSAEQLYEKYGAGYEFGVDFIPKSFRFIPMSVKI